MSSVARERLSVVLATMLDEPIEVARDIAAFFDVYLARVPRMTALGVRISLFAVVWLPLLFVGRPRPADKLPEPIRARYLTRWTRSRSYFVREAFFLVKTVALLGWGAHAAVRARLGVPPLRAEERLA